MLPGPLTRATHDEQVAVPGLTARTLGEGPGPLARVAQEVFARRSADDLDP